ncbi:MAG TPA: tryptophan 7-halogenase [Xanthomonadaceae bacterium]|nr:tryptophan 7-halogenase [Xanthomonadaceae bacterium]
MSRVHREVAILGGGLAGLCLAIQLRRQDPEIGIRVLERRAHPVPEAAFKVGESTVEIGAHYFAEVLGLREHLDREQIRKFGFRFFFSHAREAIGDCLELGPSHVLPTPAWQIDRGRFENFLGTHARAMGIEFVDGATVTGVALGDDAPHRVDYRHGADTHTIQARWVVDATGRAGVLKRQLGLAQANAHDANSAWFRIAGHVRIDEWCADAAWQARCTPPERWRSTNHLVGPGYWVWLIPLSSGSHSVGIVADAAMHPLAGMNTLERAMDWLRANQPRLATALEGRLDSVQDFLFFRDFSYGCRQVFSHDRWALTGDAGLFLDPFYSPGSDFIAIGNGYIADLIARDRAGEPFSLHADIYQQLYFSFYESTLVLYQGQYPLFGRPEVLPAKIIWDYTYYWGVLAALYFAGRLTDIALLGRLRGELGRAKSLNLAMQELFRAWGEAAGDADAPAMLDQCGVDWFAELNRALNDRLDDDALVQRIGDNVARLEALAAETAGTARGRYPQLDTGAIDALAARAPAVASLSAHWYPTAAA